MVATLRHPWNRDLIEEEAEIARRRLARARRGADVGDLSTVRPRVHRLRHDHASMQRRAAHLPRPRRRGAGHRPAALSARGRARAHDQRLGPLGAHRGPVDRTLDRLPLQPVVPLRGRGHRERAGRRRRAAGLQPLRRAAARRADDRQGDQGGALRARGRCTSPSSTSSRAIPASACCCPRSAPSPRTRPTCTACSTTSSSSCSCSPRAARAPRSSTRTATACAASAAAAS